MARGDGADERMALLEARIAALEQRLEQQAQVRETAVVVAAIRDREIVEQHAFSNRLEQVESRIAAMDRRVTDGLLDGVTLGGYGELHYNNLSGRGGAPDKRELDFHRFVLTFGKTFNERLRFNSELELEHVMAGKDEKGYMALEQAYLDFDLNARHTARAGLFLMPVGLVNPTHEPPRFYGVERNPVEREVIPTTWFEAGVGMHGLLTDQLRYEVYLHSGLKTDMLGGYSVRSGRQKVSYADASAPAATLALNWSMPGITLGGSVQYQSDITQRAEFEKVSALFHEFHLDAYYGAWALRMLYAQWHLDGAEPALMGADRQYGWYVEPSYRLTSEIGVFVRYNEWNTLAGNGVTPSHKRQVDFGVNWQPYPQVVIKADYQCQVYANGQSQNGVNLGVGYEF
jgi:hypothetical protein